MAGVDMVALWRNWGAYHRCISLRDNAFMLPIIASVCYTRMDRNTLRLLDVRDEFAEGLHYHKLLFDEIAHQRVPSLGSMVGDIDRVLIGMYRVAHALDMFVADDYVRNYLQSLMPKATTPDVSTTLVQFAQALGEPMIDSASAPETISGSDVNRELLQSVYVGLNQARGDLQDTIKRLVVAHGKVAGITREPDDWTFVADVQTHLAQQSQRLEARHLAVNTLRRNCEVAAAVHTH